MVHFLKCMTLQVRVPVLSEKRYFTWKRQQIAMKPNHAYSNRPVQTVPVCNSNEEEELTWPSSSLRLDVLAMAGVSVSE